MPYRRSVFLGKRIYYKKKKGPFLAAGHAGKPYSQYRKTKRKKKRR